MPRKKRTSSQRFEVYCPSNGTLRVFRTSLVGQELRLEQEAAQPIPIICLPMNPPVKFERQVAIYFDHLQRLGGYTLRELPSERR
jgi:hypothetical protein